MELKFKLKHISSLLSSPGKGLGNLWRFLTTKSADDVLTPKKNVCVSIERHAISVSFVSHVLSKTTIQGFRKYTFEGEAFPNPDEAATSVSLAIEELEAKSAEVTLGVPKAWTVIRTVELPAAARENLASAIKYDMDRLTPFDQDKVYFGFRILNETAETLTIVLYAAKADLINRYLDALRERGITVGKVIFNLAGIGALLRYMDKGKDSIFLEIDETGYDGALYLDGFVVEAFTGQFRKDDEKTNLDILIRRLFPYKELYRHKGKIPHLILLGQDKSPLLSKLVGQSEGLPVTLLNDDFVKPTLTGTLDGIPYATIGGALESYLPEETDMLRMGLRKVLKTPVALSVILVLALLGLLALFAMSPLKAEKRALAEIDRQIRLQKNEVTRALKTKEEVEVLEAEIDGIRTFKGNTPIALQIIKEVTANLPGSAWATTFKFKGNSVIVSGYADSSAGLLSKLEASSYLKNVAFMSPTLRDRRTNKERFSIKMEVEGAGTPRKGGGK